MNDYFKQLKDLDIEAKKHKEEVTKNIKQELKEKIALETAKIKLEYESKIKENEKIDTENMINVINLKKTIWKYSIFDSKDLGNIVAELISTYTKRNFVYEEQIIHYIHTYPFRATTSYSTALGIIVEESKRKNDYLGNDTSYDQTYRPYGEELNNLMAYYHAFIFLFLCEDELIIYNSQADNLLCKLAFYPLFSFVKEFLNYVINYRIENNLKVINIDQLTALKEEFILLHQLEINEWCNEESKVMKRREKARRLFGIEL